jgi:hypothetical protein
MGYKEQRRKMGKREGETRNRDLRLGKRTGDKEQRRKIGNRGWETRNREGRHGTDDGRQGIKK